MERQEWRDKISMFQNSDLSGGGGSETVYNRSSQVPQEGQSLAGIESKKVKLHTEHTFIQLTGKAVLKFILSDTERILCAFTVIRKSIYHTVQWGNDTDV